MKDIIINQPHLQSLQQKCGSVFMSILSWMLWIYFLWPIFTLGVWLMGVKDLSDDIRWFGGYKSLLDMLALYGEIIVLIALLWLIWSLFLSWLSNRKTPSAASPVTEQAMSTTFKVAKQQLQQAKKSHKITVHFDENALITALDYDQSHNQTE